MARSVPFTAGDPGPLTLQVPIAVSTVRLPSLSPGIPFPPAVRSPFGEADGAERLVRTDSGALVMRAVTPHPPTRGGRVAPHPKGASVGAEQLVRPSSKAPAPSPSRRGISHRRVSGVSLSLSTVVPDPRQAIDFRSPRMAMRPHPVDEGLIDLVSVRRKLVAAFMEDRRLSEVECATLDAFDAAVAPIRAYRARERYADYWLKEGDMESRYGRQLATDAGARIERLEVQHQRPRVIRLRHHEDGGTAA